jgi:hypothetical protein
MNKTDPVLSSAGKKTTGVSMDHLWLSVPFFIVVLKGFRFPLPSLDFWWHLKMGELIAQNHSIPRVDLFSFTAAGKMFIDQNWLAEVIYFLSFRLGGFPLLIFLNTVLLTAALIPIFLLCRAATVRPRVAGFAALASCIGLFPNARPQVFSVVLFAFFYLILDGFRFRRRNLLWLMPVLMVFWVNLHGAFVVGMALIALILLSETACHYAAPGRADVLTARELKQLAVVLLVCILASMINPETYRIYDYIRTVLSDQASQKLVMEWQPPRIDMFFISRYYYGLFYLSLLGLILARREKNLTDIVLFLGFSVFGFVAVRNTIWFAVVTAPLIARYWGDVEFWPNIQRWTGTSIAGGKGTIPPKQHYKFNAVLLLFGILATATFTPWLSPRFHKTTLIDPKIPKNCFDYIEQNTLRGRIFHPQVYGDYLIWRLYPRQRSFVDGRVHLFGEAFVDEYLNIFYDSGWESKLAQYGIQYLLLSKDTTEDGCRALIPKARSSKNWKVLFEDDTAVIFARNR